MSIETQRALEGIVNIEDVLEVITFSTPDPPSPTRDSPVGNTVPLELASQLTPIKDTTTAEVEQEKSKDQLSSDVKPKKNLANNIQVRIATYAELTQINYSFCSFFSQ